MNFVSRTVALAAGLACVLTQAQAATMCFTVNDNAGLPFEVWQIGRPWQTFDEAPPNVTTVPYLLYPESAVATGNIRSIDGNTTTDVYYDQWANHGARPVPRGNVAPGVNPSLIATTVLNFSTPQAADACTLAQTKAVLGRLADAKKDATAAHLTPVTTPPYGQTTTDVCVLSFRKLEDNVKGIVLDYEPGDGRTEAETASFLAQWAALVKGRSHGAKSLQTILFTDPWDSGAMATSGISSRNAPSLVDLFGRSTIFLWSQNQQHDITKSYNAQIATLGGLARTPAAKLQIVFEMAGTTKADALAARSLVTANGHPGVMVFRNLARPGGACTNPYNTKLAALIWGR